MSSPIRKNSLKEKDRELIKWLKKSGRAKGKIDLFKVIRRSVRLPEL